MQRLRLTVIDVAHDEPLPRIDGKICELADASCVEPLQDVRSNSDGVIEESIPSGFEGYLQFAVPGYLPVLYFVPGVLRQDTTLEVPIPREELLAELAARLDVELDPDRGHVVLNVEDCFGAMAADVVLSSPQAGEGTERFFAVAGAVSRTADATDDVGLGGFLNFSPVTPSIEARVKTTGAPLRPVSLVVRPGTVTVASVQP